MTWWWWNISLFSWNGFGMRYFILHIIYFLVTTTGLWSSPFMNPTIGNNWKKIIKCGTIWNKISLYWSGKRSIRQSSDWLVAVSLPLVVQGEVSAASRSDDCWIDLEPSPFSSTKQQPFWKHGSQSCFRQIVVPHISCDSTL